MLAKAHAAALANHAIDATFLKQAQDLADAFQRGQPVTQSLLDVRQNANATYEEVHEAEMAQI